MNEVATPSVDDPAEIQVGRRLRAAREAAGLGLAEVAAMLRLSERQVVALETGDLEKLPGKTFVRGFVRNYARALSFDSAPLLALLDRAGLAPPLLNFPESTHVAMPAQGQEGRRRDRVTVGFGFFFLIVAVVAAFILPDRILQDKVDETGNDPASATLPVPENEGAPEETPAEQEEEAGNTATSGANSAATAAATTAQSAATASAPAGEHVLHFEFGGDSWVEVKNEKEERLTSRLHEAGTTRDIPVTPPITVVIGRASGVRLSYNGNPVPLKPNGNDVAVFRLP
ncbi:MAG: DUF4115 domain-containing protein [Zoogloeaceae bacterium]|jgi:cytoskeleton protein RodZ|nr:DUF4115 domain-containing protein [Zoogloeaceae bacterium]